MISTHSRSPHFRTAPPDAPRQGFSLIEVAIALVIFVIGALAIIRIFPGALNVIGNNGNQQIARNLNTSVTSRMKSVGAVPAATFNIKINADKSIQWSNDTNHTDDFEDINASIIGIPRLNYTLPIPEDINTGANNSSLSRFRGIIGEQAQVVKIGTIFYALTQFPISLEKINSAATESLVQPTVSQEYIVRNARIDKNKNVSFDNATTIYRGQEYNLNYVAPAVPTVEETAAAAEMLFRRNVTANSMVYVSYRYFHGGNPWGVQEEAVPVPNALNLATATVTVSPPDLGVSPRDGITPYDPTIVPPLPNNTGTVAESIDVRVKNFIGAGGFGGGSTIEQNTNARCGLIVLPNPSNRLNDSNITETVSVDYVADWSLLLQQGNPSLISSGATSNSQLPLAVPFIEDQIPVGIYSLLLTPSGATPPPPPPPPNANIENFNVTSGQFGTNGLSGSLVQPTENELRDGRVSFTGVTNNTKARVSYRTRDLWVQQLSVAAATYKPYAVTAGSPNSTEPWRDYFLGDNGYLYFHAGEAGKTISVSYITNETGNPKIVDRPFVIETSLVDAGTLVPTNFIVAPSVASRVPSDSTGTQTARVKLTNLAGGNLSNADLLSIQSINGISVTARTAYINGNQYKQKIDTTTRGAN